MNHVLALQRLATEYQEHGDPDQSQATDSRACSHPSTQCGEGAAGEAEYQVI